MARAMLWAVNSVKVAIKSAGLIEPRTMSKLKYSGPVLFGNESLKKLRLMSSAKILVSIFPERAMAPSSS